MIEEIFKTNGWYQGEDFGDGVYIQASITSLLNLEKIMKNGISCVRGIRRLLVKNIKFKEINKYIILHLLTNVDRCSII